METLTKELIELLESFSGGEFLIQGSNEQIRFRTEAGATTLRRGRASTWLPLDELMGMSDKSVINPEFATKRLAELQDGEGFNVVTVEERTLTAEELIIAEELLSSTVSISLEVGESSLGDGKTILPTNYRALSGVASGFSAGVSTLSLQGEGLSMDKSFFTVTEKPFWPSTATEARALFHRRQISELLTESEFIQLYKADEPAFRAIFSAAAKPQQLVLEVVREGKPSPVKLNWAAEELSYDNLFGFLDDEEPESTPEDDTVVMLGPVQLLHGPIDFLSGEESWTLRVWELEDFDGVSV